MNGNHRIASQRRSGFTLIELLVVIAIIAILAGLLLAGVMVFLRKGPEVRTRHDILQLTAALQQFKAKYNRYPPNTIRLRANPADYSPPSDQLDKDSLSFLNVMWPQFSNCAAPIAWAGYDASNQPIPLPANGIVLEGDQCLVFFLGGPPIGGGQPGLMGGFSIDPLSPVAPPGTGKDRLKKYFDFEAARLVNRTSNAYPAGNPFPSYLDPYETLPFVYFSSTNTFNRYDTTANSLGITPYAKNVGLTQFYNADTFQLISAGADGPQSLLLPPQGGFGAGGFWTPGSATGFGKDDVSNFHDKALGIP